MNVISMNSVNNESDSYPLVRDIDVKRECLFNSIEETKTDKSAKTKLMIATILCIIFFFAEIVGGILANSLAILTDSAHLLSDLSSFIISLVAIYLSSRKSTKSMTFGWDRAEILGALFSVLLIWTVTGILVYAAVSRVVYPNYVIDSKIMLIMSSVGLFINVLLAVVLHPHSHSHSHSHGHSHSGEYVTDADDPLLDAMSDSIEDLHESRFNCFKEADNINLRAAFIHVVGDIIQSIGVLAAALVIYFKPQWKIADPICTFLFSLLVLLTTVFIFRDVVNVLLERKPRHLSYNEIENHILTIPGVLQIHNLRLWSITMKRVALSCHLFIDSSLDSQTILDQVYDMCINEFKIRDVSIQLESNRVPLEGETPANDI